MPDQELEMKVRLIRCERPDDIVVMENCQNADFDLYAEEFKKNGCGHPHLVIRLNGGDFRFMRRDTAIEILKTLTK